MFCKNCGSEIANDAVVCPHCGVQVGQLSTESSSKEMCVLSIVGFALSFIACLAGLIVSIIAYKQIRENDLNGKSFAIAGIAISAVSLALAVLLISIYIIIILGAISAGIMVG